MKAKQAYFNALKEIQLYYGDKTAERSGVRLINHIHEGCVLIYEMGGLADVRGRNTDSHKLNETYFMMAAFCLHPIAQNEGQGFPFLVEQDLGVVELAQDYAVVANHYLCRPETDHITTFDQLKEHIDTLDERYSQNAKVMTMLYADKVQNEKDFNLYHKETHPRSKELTRYFALWIEYLECWVYQ